MYVLPTRGLAESINHLHSHIQARETVRVPACQPALLGVSSPLPHRRWTQKQGHSHLLLL